MLFLQLLYKVIFITILGIEPMELWKEEVTELWNGVTNIWKQLSSSKGIIGILKEEAIFGQVICMIKSA